MNHAKTIFLATVLLSTAACSQPANNTVGTAVNKSGPAAESRSVGKPSAPAMVAFEQLGSTAVLMGVPISVKTVVTPTADVDDIEVRFSLSDGLQGAQSLPLLAPGLQKVGTPLSQTLVFVPRAEGQQYLNVFVTTRQGQQRMSKTVSYPVAVGNIAANKPKATVLTTPDGERVISMPATELR